MPNGALLLAGISLLNLGIGLSVYGRNQRAPLNRSFCCTALAVALWTAALAWGRLQPLAFETAIRAAFSAGSLVPLGVIYFVEHFGTAENRNSRQRLHLLGILAAIFSLLSFSPWMVTRVTAETYGTRSSLAI
jgi:hypothetical protein